MLANSALSELPLSTVPSTDVTVTITAVQDSNTAFVEVQVGTGKPSGADDVFQAPVFKPQPIKEEKKVKKTVKLPKKVVKPAPTPEEIQALADAMLLNIPVDPEADIDFVELRNLIAVEQERIRQEQLRIEEEEFIIALLMAQHRKKIWQR